MAGDAGVRDGRLDVLLDKGVYKLRLSGAKIANGDAALSVAPFVPLAAADTETPARRRDERRARRSPATLVLGARRIPASACRSTPSAGRCATCARGGTERTSSISSRTPRSVEPKAGRPLTRLRLDGVAEPGLYLVTAYGGEALQWTDGDTAQPFYVQAGTADLPARRVGRRRRSARRGSLRYALPTRANYARIDLLEVAPLRLGVRRGKTSWRHRPS